MYFLSSCIGDYRLNLFAHGFVGTSEWSIELWRKGRIANLCVGVYNDGEAASGIVVPGGCVSQGGKTVQADDVPINKIMTVMCEVY